VAGELTFDWNKANIEHIALHRVTPVEVEQVFANDPAYVGYDEDGSEPRWTVMGHTNDLRVLVVVWTLRGDAIRSVTAWEASRRVRERYFRARGIS
jgi:uncharacterized DUF497 family protein